MSQDSGSLALRSEQTTGTKSWGLQWVKPSFLISMFPKET